MASSFENSFVSQASKILSHGSDSGIQDEIQEDIEEDEVDNEFQFLISGGEKRKRDRGSLSICGVPQNWQSTCNLYKKYLSAPWGSKFPPTMTLREQNAL